MAQFWCLGQAFDLELGYFQYFLVMIGANVILAVPITPWSIGSFELAVTAVMALPGIDRAVAAGYALGAHVLLMTWIGLMGIIATWALGLGPSDLLGWSEPAPEAGESITAHAQEGEHRTATD